MPTATPTSPSARRPTRRRARMRACGCTSAGPRSGPTIPTGSSSPQAQFFGFSIATAGDVDGDGFSEFLVGDPNDSFVEGAMEGTATLFELARSVPVSQPTGPNDGQPDTRRGTSLAISPAMEPSGFPRLIVGEPGD